MTLGEIATPFIVFFVGVCISYWSEELTNSMIASSTFITEYKPSFHFFVGLILTLLYLDLRYFKVMARIFDFFIFIWNINLG